ncbi:alpha-mannosidase [Krasilnikovia sp. MM14-A1259]|uniref:alpha-mannosidase n=1 Tax=Krasilnikovia sp. MM14-A1259 TaxID=3373539 RepID=UPI00382C9DD7
MSVRTVQAGLLAAGLVCGLLSVPGAAQAEGPRPSPSASAGVRAAAAGVAVVEDPTNQATDENKVKAAGAIGVNPGVDLLVLNDQAFVFALWRRAEAGPYVKAAAMRAYESDDARAAYDFIVTGIFVAANDDAQAEITAEAAKARRRSVAVTVGLDPSDTALIERDDRDFIFAVWQRSTSGTHVWTAARDAIADGTGQGDWDAFLNTGAAAAADQDMREAIEKADEEQAAKLRAERLAGAKKSLLQLLLLPVTDELVKAPNRQYVLFIHNNAKGSEVSLASQVALNAPDDQLEQALTDFIFTGGAAANKRDEDAAAAKELAGYRDRVTPIRDAATHDGFSPNLLAAADRALADNTLVALQTFLLKGQDEARAKDRRLDFSSGFEATDARPNWQNTVDSTGGGHGGTLNVGGIVGTVTTSELGVRTESPHTGTNALMYSGMDNSATKSYSYNQVFGLKGVSVRPTTKMSYWIFPESPTKMSKVSGTNSTCVAVDLIFSDGTNLRDSGAKDQRGNSIHPGAQCGKLTLDTWNEVDVDLGAVAAGRTILRVTVGYDQPANTGGYRGFIDDLSFTDLESAPKFRTSAESGDTKLTWTNSVDTGAKPAGGAANVGPLVSSVTGPELKEGPATGRTGSGIVLYSGKDNSATSSYAYMKGYSLGETYVTPTTRLSYWVYPQSSAKFSGVTGSNSSCVSLDLLLEDKIAASTVALRSTGVKDNRGNVVHPGKQCGKLPLDTWTQVVVPLGAIANGKRIVQIDFGYDQPAGTGGYRGYLDDIRITQ